MSAVLVLKVWCDGDFAGCHGYASVPTVDADEARARLTRSGWVYVGRDFDLCPICAAEVAPAELVDTARKWSE